MMYIGNIIYFYAGWKLKNNKGMNNDNNDPPVGGEPTHDPPSRYVETLPHTNKE